MKKILLSLGMLTFVAAAAVGGTGAFFSDEVTSEENVFTAGEVTLTANGIAYQYNGADANDQPTFTDNGFSFTLDDIKPDDEGIITYNLTNGSNDATVCVMVDETGNDDNLINNPETNAGDASDGPGAGELGAFLNVNVEGNTGSLASLSGTWFDLGIIPAGDPVSSALEYCFGEFDGGGACVANEDLPYNLAQTDQLEAEVMFYAEQARNNDFTCAELNEEQEIEESDLFTADDRTGAFLSQDWFFYNDTNDTIMSINQFSTDGGTNEITTAAGRGAAVMILDDGTSQPYVDVSRVGDPRYNIATYKFDGTPMVGVTDLKYTVYDESEGTSQTPFFHFNVSFDGTDSWQNRLVHVPGASTNPAVPGDTWTEVDAIDGGGAMWTWSGYSGTWPAQPGVAFADPTAQYQSWADIVAAYPSLQVRDTDSFFGVRVGHPGPVGEESYVDSISFNGVLYDFEN